jgi:hypothetical protein
MKTLKKMLLWALAVICVVLSGCADLQIQVDRALRYDECRKMGYTRDDCHELMEQRYNRPPGLRPPVVRPKPPASPTPPIDVEESLVINTPSGDVVVYNVFLYPETKIYYEEGKTQEPAGAFLKQTDEYVINYVFSNQSFQLILMRNVQFARGKAERVLIQKLQTPPETICLLDVSVTVMGGTESHPRADFNYGLSFCPGSRSIRLP